MARYDSDVKNKVRQQYVFNKLSLSSIALVVDVPYQTVCRWKKIAKEKGDDWDKAKTASMMAGGEIEDIARQILDEFVVQYLETFKALKAEDMPSDKKAAILCGLSDGYLKMINANKKLLPEIDEYATALKTINLLGEYIAMNKPLLIEEFTELFNGFDEVLAKEMQ